ncbi:hypothetical protein RCH23_000050 [Cryobacterium sp. CAN_C3]|nr:hypothetical protein [Cryobacterium sp. CAN_C3]
MTRFDGSDAVHVQRWQWDGRRRAAVAEPLVSADPAGSLW